MQPRKRVIILLVVAALTAAGLLIFKSSQLPASPPMPSPNGYDDFVKAGQMLAGKTSYYREMNEEELRKLVTDNAEALHLVRTGLSRKCCVPHVYSQSYMGGHLSDLGSIKRLAQALNAEGRLAELEHRNHDAAKAHLETIQLGQEAMRGGVLIDALVGIACEAIGSTGLQTLLANLDAAECRDVSKALEGIDSKQESFAEIMKNDREFVRHAYPWPQLVVGRIQRVFNFGSIKQSEQRALQKFQTQAKRRRELILELAARAYELEKGQPPKSIADLVPDYLQVVPKDPLAGTNMVYRP